MSAEKQYHALKVNETLCYGCTHCMNLCPTGAIRIYDGKASIRREWCVDCGECMRACPVSAFYVEQDDFDKIFDFKYRVALLPAVMTGQFHSNVSESEIFSVMREIGFTHVFQTEHTVDVVNDRIVEEQMKNTVKPLISSYCPAVVRLIQVRFPSLVDHIVPVKPPIDASALFFRKKFSDMGIPDDEIGIFYVTPCPAKIAAVKSPVGEEKSSVNGVINMDFLYNKVLLGIRARAGKTAEPADAMPNLSAKSILWNLTNGEAPYMRGRCLAIDEIHNVIDFLEKIENDEITNVDFLELRSCDESCAGGVLVVGNRFLTAERLHKRANLSSDIHGMPEDLKPYSDYLKKKLSIHPVEPRSMLALDEDRGKAVQKMLQVRKMMCYLPGIDCGACGAPNCQSLAKDIVKREAQLSNCVFIQRMMEKNKKLHGDHAIRIIEKVWGKDRLNKDCTKPGAKNEGM
ncbi:MAG: 4Fe-4S binding protein [Bacteroidales bacterium]|jgi:iron only hydrogenase large subunit-like protein|nr:4Fe-4S binding protein [Bacteroidales bacterium]